MTLLLSEEVVTFQYHIIISYYSTGKKLHKQHESISFQNCEGKITVVCCKYFW